ncbi:MAG: Gfo/Idh/MocA family oxidoreductase [Chloroflexota bacterium]|jgi:2-hydroxy-4-carboxymuconate semialdehyde hemiacetal dehydrogenase|nr:Gfo/Idh/MocA family oxidoreductase [Chloroflexota bacterium]MDP6509369.1 Gfo/Idh/MocA family oxidoreductase [Chloroflexota bacterium]MDP6756807.1 Gfo/Idh/MocA family oxidoreductase [Chloroflexota bacterium]
MRFCIAGYGAIAAHHRDALLAMDGVGIDVVMGRRIGPTREFAETCGAALATTDLAEALAQPRIDAVLVASPSQVHYEQTRAALAAGKHVLLEIPMALGLAAAEELCALADAAGRTLMICHTHRYRPFIRGLKRRISEGDLHLHHLHCEWHFFRRSDEGFAGSRRSWTDNLLWHHAGHVVDDAVWLFGKEPERAEAVLGPSGGHGGISRDLGAHLQFAGGGIASYAMSYNAHVSEQRVRISFICEEDTFTLEGDHFSSHDATTKHLDLNEASIPRQNVEFVDAVREGRKPLTAGRAMLASMRTLHRLEVSANRPAAADRDETPV